MVFLESFGSQLEGSQLLKFCGFEQFLAAQYAFVITGSFTRHIDYMVAFVLDVTLIYLCILFKFIKHYWKSH